MDEDLRLSFILKKMDYLSKIERNRGIDSELSNIIRSNTSYEYKIKKIHT